VFGALLRAIGVNKEKSQHLPQNDSERIQAIYDVVNEVRDELRPMGPDGQRVSRLDMIMGGVARLNPEEREAVKQELESLEVDDQIIIFIEKPKSIEEIAKQIGRSYGYTAARLRKLMGKGRVMRKRDAVTRKYVYVKM